MIAEQHLRRQARNNPGPAREVLRDLLLEQGRSETELPILLESPEKVEALRHAGLLKGLVTQRRLLEEEIGGVDARACEEVDKLYTALEAPLRNGGIAVIDPSEDALGYAVSDDDQVIATVEDAESALIMDLLDRASTDVQDRILQLRRDDAFAEALEDRRRDLWCE